MLRVARTGADASAPRAARFVADSYITKVTVGVDLEEDLTPVGEDPATCNAAAFGGYSGVAGRLTERPSAPQQPDAPVMKRGEVSVIAR